MFDESLPANTPLCKGGTPVRQRNLNAASPLQSPVHEQLLQPNFDDSEENLVSGERHRKKACFYFHQASLFFFT